MKKETRSLTFSAVCTALGVVILYIGSLVEVLDLTTVFIASLLVVFVIDEFRAPWFYLTWIVTSILSVLLLPNKFCALEYAFFGGAYPIVKYYAERLPRAFARLVKFLSFNLMFAAVLGLSAWFFGVETIALPGIGEISPWGLFALLMILGNIVFLIYDYLITRLVVIYHLRWRTRLEKYLR